MNGTAGIGSRKLQPKGRGEGVYATPLRTHRVKRRRTVKGKMVARWASSALLVVEKRLHKVKGASLLNSLVQALEKVDLLEKTG